MTKPQRRLTTERVVKALGAQSAQNQEVITRTLTRYTEMVIDPLVARIEALEAPWYRKLWRRPSNG